MAPDACSIQRTMMTAVASLWAVVACAPPAPSELAEALSANPCTAVKLTAPLAGFTIAAGVPVALAASATCPAGQTPEYQYWVRLFDEPNWTRLGGYVPGESSWTPPSEEHWCVSVVTRAVGAPNYEARSSASCSTPRCGNRIVDPGEQCDDGNFKNGDTCDVNCTFPGCGNTILDAGEACDDGNLIDADGCEADCTRPRCGNGILDPGEPCDDGNPINGDACDVNCTVPACGNAVVDPGEECDDGNPINGDACDLNCTAPRCGNGEVSPGEQCDDGNTADGDGCEATCTLVGLSYIKASNTGRGDVFGWTFSLSADGATLAVGVPNEDSAATGINGNQEDDSAESAGAVYVFVRSGDAWSQQAYLKATNADAGDGFGETVALSADGATLAVGAGGEDGFLSPGNEVSGVGAVYVFTRSATTWSQTAYLKPPGLNANEGFGGRVVLSADGATLAATSVIGDAVHVFTRSGAVWTRQASLQASNPGGPNDQFGWKLALSGDGDTLAAGAAGEASAATGIDGDQGDNAWPGAGAVYVFHRSGTAWTQQAYVKASNTGRDDQFGWSVALSGDGSMLAVGARFEDSAATGVAGNQADNTVESAGAVYVFGRSGATWSQQAYVKASNTGSDGFGWSVALSTDGSILAVGAPGEASSATGINGHQGDDSMPGAGAVYRFTRAGATWIQDAYVKASNPDAGDDFGWQVAISGDGGTLAVCAITERSAATGIGGDQHDNSLQAAGAMYVFP